MFIFLNFYFLLLGFCSMNFFEYNLWRILIWKVILNVNFQSCSIYAGLFLNYIEVILFHLLMILRSWFWSLFLQIKRLFYLRRILFWHQFWSWWTVIQVKWIQWKQMNAFLQTELFLTFAFKLHTLHTMKF